MIAKVVGVGDDGQKTGAESLVEGLMEGRRHRVRFKLLYRQGLDGILSWTQNSINELPTHEADVCFGSKADVQALNCDVRYTPESGHSTDGRDVR